MGCAIREVAKRASVSVATVSHVLNKTRYVAPETEQRVLDAVQALNYYKNAHARRLARGGSDIFGLIISDIENPFFPELIKSFETEALVRGCDLLLCTTNYDPARTQAAVRRMIENKARGVAVMTSQPGSGITEELVATQMPVVFLDLGRVGPYISNIRIDHTPGTSRAIRHLYDLGHRKFAFISGPQNRHSAVRYRDAFIAALKRQDLSSRRIVEGNNKVESGSWAVRMLLEQPDLPTAILCSSDLTAVGAMAALRDAALRVPEDVSVIGSDDVGFADIANPPLTTLRLSRERLGKLAFEALEKILHSKRRHGAEFVMETELVVRRSTGPARSGDLHRSPS